MVGKHEGRFLKSVETLARFKVAVRTWGWPRASLQRQLMGHNSRNGGLLVGDRLADIHHQGVGTAEVEHSGARARVSLFKVHMHRVQGMADVGLEKTGR